MIGSEFHWLFLAAFCASAFGGALGMASGIFIVPILTLLFGLDIRVAIGASIVSVIACSCASAAPLLRARLPNVRLAIVLESATTLGALSGVWLVGSIPTAWLYALFALILAISSRQMLARRTVVLSAGPVGTRGLADRLRLHGSYSDPASGHSTPYRVDRVPLGLGLMYGAGMISALLGIGSGVLKIPAMDGALRLPLKVSSATSNFMIGVTAAASAAAYFARGDIDMAIAPPVMLGSVVGAWAGAHAIVKVPGDKLRIAFIAVLMLLAVCMLLAAAGVTLPGAAG
ncbi:sulfite exporter TauE/SafE family protein [Bordetella sp. H567]|uniref:sulfite exporter TauE/SafE family protein n=1 Tax=Bordetella sp. H567 TaxID=1697043 RepID=UPI000ABEC418|nr:sulfite exporter TauE/SafE family protein [Bordetella sp. H567]